MSTRIEFYKNLDKYGELSNFFQAPVYFEKIKYTTSEHLYQSIKFMIQPETELSREYREIIRNSSTPYISKLLANGTFVRQNSTWANKVNHTIKVYKEKGIKYNSSFWNSSHIILPLFNDVFIKDVGDCSFTQIIKVQAMLLVLRLKFLSDEHCRKILLSTELAELCEKSSDEFWGLGKSNKGHNVLGLLLMQVRIEIQIFIQLEIKLELIRDYTEYLLSEWIKLSRNSFISTL